VITGRRESASGRGRTSRSSLGQSGGNAEVQDSDRDHRTTARNSPDGVMTVDIMEDGINRIAVSRVNGINHEIM